jgi:hypothetical protein
MRLGKPLVVAFVVLCVGVAGVTTAYAGWTLERLGDVDRPLSEFAFDEDGMHYDLSQGEYLVALMSMGCEHCQASVPDLNDIVMNTDMPTVVALCYEEGDDTVDTFRAVTQPLFPLHSVGDRIRKFFSLVGEGQVPPRFLVIRDGAVVRDWYETAPAPEEVLEALRAPSR